MAKMNDPILLLDGARGRYLPRDFALLCGPVDGWSGFDPETLAILEEGPDHSDYWEAWNDIVGDAVFTDPDGQVWTIFQHGGDVFVVPEGWDIPEGWIE